MPIAAEYVLDTMENNRNVMYKKLGVKNNSFNNIMYFTYTFDR